MGRLWRFFCVLACLLLCGCGVRGETPEPQSSILGAAAGVEDAAPLLCADGREVPAWRYLYWLSRLCGQLSRQYGDLPIDWTAPVGGGTLADYAKDQALADTVLYAVVENWAERYDCPLNDEDALALEEQWRQKEADLSALSATGLDRERYMELQGVGRMYRRLCALAQVPDSPLAPTEEELAAFARSCFLLDRILVPFGPDRSAAKEQAAALFSRLNQAEDPTALFPALTAEGADTAGPRLFEEGLFSAPLTEAALSLAEGQCSGILEDDEGFSILCRLPMEPQALGEAYFDARLQSAAHEAAVTLYGAYETIRPADFHAALTRLRQELP